MRRLIPTVTLVLLFLTSQTVKGQEQLRVIGQPTAAVATSCNPTGEATTSLTLRNEGSAAVSLHPFGTDLSRKNPAKSLSVRPTLVANDANLEHGKESIVQVKIAGLYEDGEWESTIQNNGVDVGTLKVDRVTPAFLISLDVPKPDEAELTFTKGEPEHFFLKNADSHEYRIGWEYSVNGRVEGSEDLDQSTEPENRPWYRRWFNDENANKKAVKVTTGLVTIPAGSEKEIVFYPPPSWFGNSFVGLFKDRVIDDSRLTARLMPVNCTNPAITKTFKVKTTLATSSGPGREGWADFWVFIFLALGGIFSLGLNSMLPNQARRIKAKDQLSKLGSQITNLSYALASRLRVLVGLEHRLICDRLRDLTWTSTDFAGEMQSIEQAMARLTTRLQFLDVLGTVRANFMRMQADILPPNMNFALEEKFEKIIEIGEKSEPTDDDVQAALALIKGVQDQLDCGVQGSVDFAKSLVAQATKFKEEFHPTTGRIGKTDTCKRIRTSFPGPFDRLDVVDATTIACIAPADTPSAQDKIHLDERLFQLERIREYVDLVEGMAADDKLRVKITSHENGLLDYLKLPNYDAMYAARLLIKQMEDGYFKDDIEKEVRENRVRIRVDHAEIRQFEPCEFRLEFLKSALNIAYARQEWACRWIFTLPATDPAQALVEEGWVVTHYFQKGSQYELKISLTHEGCGDILPVPKAEVFLDGKISVIQGERSIWRFLKALRHWNWGWAKKEWQGRRRSRKGLDYLRLAMALVIALFGLIAGAKEQLLKLDVLPALVAIFMVGFSADQIKNLLTQKTPGSETNTSH
jgi:hypothetical protein